MILNTLIENSIDFYLTSNAVFLAEKLYYQCQNEESTYLLAKAYYHNFQFSSVYELLKQNLNHPPSMYLFSQSCIHLQKFSEGEAKLKNLLKIVDLNDPNTSFIYCTLGIILKKSFCFEESVKYFQDALLLNPFLWTAFENLCELGVNVNASEIFDQHSAQFFLNEMSNRLAFPNQSKIDDEKKSPLKNKNSKNYAAKFQFSQKNLKILPTALPSSTNLVNKVSAKRSALDSGLQDLHGNKGKKKILTRGTTHGNNDISQPSKMNLRSTSASANIKNNLTTAGKPSSLACAEIPNKEKKIALKNEENKIVRDETEEKYEVEVILDLLKTIGNGYYNLCQFNLEEALEYLQSLDLQQFNSSYVLGLIGKVKFEMGDYFEAENYFKKVRAVDLSNFKFMDLYSTVLWHQKKSVELSYLAHELIEFERLSPQSWVAIGNCFSLKKDHDNAIKCFSRAIQLDSNFCYAYTLCGHEFHATEDYTKATNSYRQAIRIDPRHYNAWYGLGQVCLAQEKFDLSHYNFEKAISINPDPKIYFSLALVSHKAKKFEQALKYIDFSIKNNKEILSTFHFQKAKTLFEMERFQESLNELLKIKDMLQESNVYFLMGKIYKKLGKKKDSIISFTFAQDCLNTGSRMGTLIKDEIESLDYEGRAGNGESFRVLFDMD